MTIRVHEEPVNHSPTSVFLEKPSGMLTRTFYGPVSHCCQATIFNVISALCNCQDRPSYWTRHLLGCSLFLVLWAGFSPLLGQESENRIELMVLGIAQDAGFPQAGCNKACCRLAWSDPQRRRWVSSLGLIDHTTGQRWLFDCSPDFPQQLRMLDARSPNRSEDSPLLDGVFLTHAHIGHYTGLIHLGREVIGASNIKTFAMPRMQKFLRKNGPWSQLVQLENIRLMPMTANEPIKLNANLSVTPITVPHRDEFSETVGFEIAGPDRKAIFLPDIDKWSKWEQSIEDRIRQVDVAYLDGTFFENGEIPGRDMSLIPHPFVIESIQRFSALDLNERNKVRFIHLNHTNPAIVPDSRARRQIEKAGMEIARQGETIGL